MNESKTRGMTMVNKEMDDDRNNEKDDKNREIDDKNKETEGEKTNCLC